MMIREQRARLTYRRITDAMGRAAIVEVAIKSALIGAAYLAIGAFLI